MKPKYRVFHDTVLHTWENGDTVTGTRPYDLRDRTKAAAIELARTLDGGEVRPKGGSRVVFCRVADELMGGLVAA